MRAAAHPLTRRSQEYENALDEEEVEEEGVEEGDEYVEMESEEEEEMEQEWEGEGWEKAAADESEDEGEEEEGEESEEGEEGEEGEGAASAPPGAAPASAHRPPVAAKRARAESAHRGVAHANGGAGARGLVLGPKRGRKGEGRREFEYEEERHVDAPMADLDW